jgi:hypothetical protein
MSRVGMVVMELLPSGVKSSCPGVGRQVATVTTGDVCHAGF